MQHKNEIDGLRAIAVIPVILFHAGVPGFSGGYIGVDIFFVISGYLITSIILEEQRRNAFSLINFYERRARRIIPALSTVLLFTTIFAYLLMPPDLLKSYSKSLISVITFSSNVFFYLTSGYFATVSDEKPLLHTWSLAVEEQYYIFFPVMISWLWLIGENKLKYIITILSLTSIAFSQYLLLNNEIDASFYIIFSRAWELFSGSLISLIKYNHKSVKKWMLELLSATGFFLIIYSIIFFDDNTYSSGVFTLIPVTGSCLIILFGNEKSLVGKILSARILVFVGLISYSLYLWHQPLLAFLRLKSIGTPEPIMFAAALMLTFALSCLSWKFIETPFRNKSKAPRKLIFISSFSSIVFFLLLGILGISSKGFPKRFNSIYAETIQSSPKREECHTEGVNYLKPNMACTYFNNNVTWAAFGDSHIVEPAYALAEKLNENNEALVHLSFSGCPPALLFNVKKPGCNSWINQSLIFIENNKKIENVLLGFRYSAFLFGEQLASYPNIPNEDILNKLSEPTKNTTNEEAREVYWNSLYEIITRLLASGKNIYIMYPIPELPMDIGKLVMPFSIFSNTPMIDVSMATPSTYYYARNKFILDKLNSLHYGKNLHPVKPFEILCNDKYCPAVKNGSAMYFDDDHLSINGAMLIANSIIETRKSKAAIAN